MFFEKQNEVADILENIKETKSQIKLQMKTNDTTVMQTFKRDDR